MIKKAGKALLVVFVIIFSNEPLYIKDCHKISMLLTVLYYSSKTQNLEKMMTSENGS